MFFRPGLILLACISLSAAAHAALSMDDVQHFNVVILGGTPGGIGAAVQAARMGKSVVLIEATQHVGGLSSSGLGMTDVGRGSAIGGVSREFYQLVKRHYAGKQPWRFEKPSQFKPRHPDKDVLWQFEPHAAEHLFLKMLHEAKVTVVLGERLDRGPQGVQKSGNKIGRVAMESGRSFAGEVFVDATYEGDLMAAAGVSFTIGREANAKYDETLNGVQVGHALSHQFTKPVDAYLTPGDKASGLIFGVGNAQPGEDGTADQRVQAYCYRMCLTDVPENRVAFPKPKDYDERHYELLLRNCEAGDLRMPLNYSMLPNRKTDSNNTGPVSTDFIGMNYDYPAASYAEREKIADAHRQWQLGLMWTLTNHPRVPASLRKEVGRWGLAKDEFTDNDHWPRQLYIREARRMVSDYVMTEQDCRRQRVCQDAIGLGSYNMDSHNAMRYVDAEGHVRNEGDVEVSPRGVYSISYRSICPKANECPNLLVPVCLSSSHIAYGSIRMEPVFLALGQAAGTAASMSIDLKCSVQEVPYPKLRERLLANKQVLDPPKK